MNESLQNIGNLIAEPSAAFSQLKSQPRWGIAFVIFYLIAGLIAWAILPYSDTLLTEQLAKQEMPADASETAENVARIFKNVFLFLGPLFALLFFMIQSALLNLVNRFLLKNDTLKFKHIYVALVHLSLIPALIQLVNAALLLIFRDPESVRSAADLKMIPGLHLLLESGASPKLAVLFSHINPLSLWVIAVMAVAIAVLADMEKNRARVVAIVLWIISILPEVVSAT